MKKAIEYERERVSQRAWDYCHPRSEKINKSEIRPIWIDQIQDAIFFANMALVKNPEDGGTCNFDAAMVKKEKGFTYDETIAMFKECGLYACKGRGWSKGWIIIDTPYGQANARTRWAESFAKTLSFKGFETSMYYQMD